MAKDKSRACIFGGKKIIALYALGILFAFAGIVMYPLMDKYIQKKVNESLVLKPYSVGFKQWKDPSVPIYLQFFMFDVVNPMEVKKGAKPFVAQIGPFSYKELRPKKNITWDSNKASVRYNEEMAFVFDPETSCESCDPNTAEITTVNIPLVTLAEAARNLPSAVLVLISTVFDNFKEKLFMKKRVHDLLWGYNDSLFLEYNKKRNEIPMEFRHFLPEISPLIALQKNNTFEGVTGVHTGEKDITKLVQWMDWKGLTKLKVWNSTYANMINGTDGSQFAPETSKDDTLYVFVTQLCRSLYLTYSGKNIKVRGIDAIQFSVPPKAFLNASLNPDNQGFCTTKCFPSGILDISVCQPPSPIKIPLFISSPHFYLGDPSLIQAVEGLSPNREEHGTFLNIEPHTGISVKSSKRLQINTKVEAVEWISQTSGINTMFFPIMFINETATLDSASAKKLKSEVLEKFTIFHGIELGLVILGALLIVIASVMLTARIVRNRNSKKVMRMLRVNAEPTETSPLLSESE